MDETRVSAREGCRAFRLGDEELIADCSGALYWPAARLLAVADLHFEKGSSYAARGALLPPYDTRATLERLAAIIARYAPETVVALGDSFHDPQAEARLGADDFEVLSRTADAVNWVWISGNHDPEPPARLGGLVRESLSQGPLRFVHEAKGAAAPGEVSGHYHPKAAICRRGRTVVRPAFIFDDRRLILPAFGTYTGGLDVLDPAIAALMRQPFSVFMTGRDRIYALTSDRLHLRDVGCPPHPASAKARPEGRAKPPQPSPPRGEG